MTIDIQSLIEQRPHLKDPLALYAKWQRFHREARELLPKGKSAISAEDSQAYPRADARAVFRLFVSVFALPENDLEPLCQALEKGAIDFMQLPQDKVPDISDLPYTPEELAGLLFLFSRPYFLALPEIFPLDGSQWENGRCPLCAAQPAMTSVMEGPKRNLHCSYCGTSGPYRFIGCPNCASVDSAQLNTIMSEDEPGFRVVTCDACQTYVKVIEFPLLKEMGFDLADLASLPLDIIAQQKGFARMAPNPISLKKIA
ncbi:formate dehydrogenase accessory protein FdhE [Desulfopila sp. IMCC35006]|uniref:formate dehydrogenase accessory protein FdhE n=1 Tax=Desulfopila sp. IMCC35006 TaxID=2569542 RepID=UPI0010ACEB00|nr:formate dehydrogenase accessory protein FdhE [Desulfopila sp. IMCC35006]TKB24835.1 formate dehydrogenase accessory protein FdhE [Desulfopila sp. IMCC35006]